MIKDVEDKLADVLRALAPFAEAYERIRQYDSDIPGDDENLCVFQEEDNSLFELFADGLEEQKLLKVGHLADACKVYKEHEKYVRMQK